MFIFARLRPKSDPALKRVLINYINHEFWKSDATSFRVDANISNTARVLFHENLRKNQLVSKFSLLLGMVGVFGLVGAAFTASFKLPYALCIAVASAVAIRVFIVTRNPEGYRLQ